MMNARAAGSETPYFHGRFDDGNSLQLSLGYKKKRGIKGGSIYITF
jgi:hypothetical protein